MSERKSSKGVAAFLALSLIANLGLGAGLYRFLENSKTAQAALDDANRRISMIEEEHRSQISVLEESFQNELHKSNEEWNRQLADEKVKQQEKLARIYEQINHLIYNSEDTLKYIDTLEGKLQEGKKLQESEIESLEMLAAGLDYLRTQYGKPIHEFKELELFLVSQLNVESMEHSTRFKFFKRMFSKEYREAEKEYYRDEGKREAFEIARTRVSAAYEDAQRKMSALTSSHAKYIEDLDAIIAGQEDHAGNLDEFFRESRKVIDIHQGIMKLQDEQETETRIEVTP